MRAMKGKNDKRVLSDRTATGMGLVDVGKKVGATELDVIRERNRAAWPKRTLRLGELTDLIADKLEALVKDGALDARDLINAFKGVSQAALMGQDRVQVLDGAPTSIVLTMKVDLPSPEQFRKWKAEKLARVEAVTVEAKEIKG